MRVAELRLVSASSDSTAQLWDAATEKPALPPFRHEGPVLWATFSPDGRAIATTQPTKQWLGIEGVASFTKLRRS